MSPVKHRATLMVASVACLAMAHVAFQVIAPEQTAALSESRPSHPAPGPEGMLIAFSVALGLSIAAGMRLWAIARRASTAGPVDRRPSSDGAGAHGPSTHHVAHYMLDIGHWWHRVFIGAVVLFVLVEGLEAAATDASLPGLIDALSADLVVVVPAMALASLLVAATMALASWCHCALSRRLTSSATEPRRTESSGATTLRPADVPLVSALLAATSSGRSPPPWTFSLA